MIPLGITLMLKVLPQGYRKNIHFSKILLISFEIAVFLTDITMSGATLNANKRQNSSFDLLSDLILNQTHRDFEIIYEQNGFEVQFNIQSKYYNKNGAQTVIFKTKSNITVSISQKR